MEVHNGKVVVVGLGKSGMAAAKLCKKLKIQVVYFDENKDLDVSNIDKKVYLGQFPEVEFANMDFAVFSPGVPLDIPLAKFFRKKNIPIIGEIELAYSLEKGRVIGITGTNGKTTTTTLVGEICKAHFDKVFVVGNIGVPYTKSVKKSKKKSITVVEISSFQLETTKEFAPNISAILNITPDHLDRHGSMEAYQKAKLAIAKKQTKDEVCILNYEDEFLQKASKDLKPKVKFFSSKTQLESGVYLNKSGDIIIAETNEVVCNISECKLLGSHNYENYMAAILIALEMKVPIDVLKKAITCFKGVEHRGEFVRSLGGVNYYNDSKATNPDAAIKGIQSMNRKTILIGGGYNKNADFTEWIHSFNGNVLKLILIGDTKDKIAKTAKQCGFHSIVMADTLYEAVEKANSYAKKGNAVLLSPACASWDMFDSYEQRGNLFKQYVNGLE